MIIFLLFQKKLVFKVNWEYNIIERGAERSIKNYKKQEQYSNFLGN